MGKHNKLKHKVEKDTPNNEDKGREIKRGKIKQDSNNTRRQDLERTASGQRLLQQKGMIWATP